MTKSDFEKKEVLWRILVGIVSGIILNIWKILILIITIFHAVTILINGKRDKGIAEFCENWNSEIYRYIRYLTFETNERPFPFTDLKKIGKFVR